MRKTVFTCDHCGKEIDEMKDYTDYEALRNCFGLIKESYKGKTIAIPYLMACHRGGGDWTVVIKLIESIFDDDDTTVLICEYNGG